MGQGVPVESSVLLNHCVLIRKSEMFQDIVRFSTKIFIQ